MNNRIPLPVADGGKYYGGSCPIIGYESNVKSGGSAQDIGIGADTQYQRSD